MNINIDIWDMKKKEGEFDPEKRFVMEFKENGTEYFKVQMDKMTLFKLGEAIKIMVNNNDN